MKGGGRRHDFIAALWLIAWPCSAQSIDVGRFVYESTKGEGVYQYSTDLKYWRPFSGDISNLGQDRLFLRECPWPVWIFFGQSNMVSRAALEDDQIYSITARAAGSHGFALVEGYILGGWSHPVMARNLLGDEAREFAVDLPFAQFAGPCIAIRAAFSGTSTVEWESDIYSRAREFVAASLADVPDNVPWRLAGVVWWQGESDAVRSPAGYAERWARLKAAIRADYGADTPLYQFTSPRSDAAAGSSIVVAAQIASAQDDPLHCVIDTSSLSRMDGVHVDADGMIRAAELLHSATLIMPPYSSRSSSSDGAASSGSSHVHSAGSHSEMGGR